MRVPLLRPQPRSHHLPDLRHRLRACRVARGGRRAAPAAAEKVARKPVKKPAYAVESVKPEDAPEAEAEEALAPVEGEEEPAAADEDETFLEEEEEDGSDMTGIIGGPVAEPEEPQ